METFREFTRSFFSLFLILSCFIGCGHSMFWIEKLADTSPKSSTYKYYRNRGYNVYEESDTLSYDDQPVMTNYRY